MPAFFQFMLISSLAQATGNLLLAGLFLAFRRIYRRSFLVLWAASWLCLGLYHLIMPATIHLGLTVGPGHFGAITSSMLGQVAGYSQAALLLFGSYELLTGRRVPRRALVVTLSVLAVSGIGGTLLSIDSTSATRYLSRVGMRSLITALAFFGTAYAIWTIRPHFGRLGRRIMSISSLLYGAEQLHYFGGSLARVFASYDGDYLIYMPYLDFLLQMAMGLGMLIWLLEDERQNITRAHEALVRSEEKLDRSKRMEVVGRLAGGIAHDFNNLLTGIIGYAELLLAELRPTGGNHEYASEIKKAADRASSLTKQLLAFGRRQLMRPRIVDLNGQIESFRPMLGQLLPANVTLNVMACAEPLPVFVDPGQIDQVVLNLVVNARDAMARTGGRLTIATSRVERAAGQMGLQPYARLSVIDTGPGIDDSIRDQIFDPFFTTKDDGKGTGLGLSTVYGIVEQSGGLLEMNSSRGRGTEFVIDLPIVDEEPWEDVESAAPVKLDLRGSEKILLVEDEETIVRLERRVLEGAGYRVLTASSGEEGFEVWKDNRRSIDLLVTDVIMPGMSGRELAERLVQAGASISVLFVSGYARDEFSQEIALDAGIDLLPKPFTPRMLLAKVRANLDARVSDSARDGGGTGGTEGGRFRSRPLQTSCFAEFGAHPRRG